MRRRVNSTVGLLLGTEQGAVATGSNTQLSSARMLRRFPSENLFDPHSKRLDPVAAAPGSVPNLSVVQSNKSLDASGGSASRN